MPDITKLKNISGVEVKAKVVTPPKGDAKIITVVKFQYEGEPSEAENLLMLEAQNQSIDAEFRTPQFSLDLDGSVAGPDPRD